MTFQFLLNKVYVKKRKFVHYLIKYTSLNVDVLSIRSRIDWIRELNRLGDAK